MATDYPVTMAVRTLRQHQVDFTPHLYTWEAHGGTAASALHLGVDEHSVVIAQCAKALAEYGVEPRHLRAFRSAADRQSDLIAQIAGPVVKGGKAGARDRADDLARDGDYFEVTCDPKAFDDVRKALEAHDVPIEDSQVGYIPTTTVDLDVENGRKMKKLLDLRDEVRA